MQKYIFLGILLAGAYRDWKTRELDDVYLIVSSAIGSVFALKNLIVGEMWAALCSSCSIGVVLLGLSYLTCGGIGEGDGWFFVVSGLFLSWKENLFLLCSGWGLCFLYSLAMLVGSIGRGPLKGKKSVPFLPFLVPAGIYLAFF